MCNDLVVLFEDNNGLWWLLGETAGCRATFSGQTDALGGNNMFELVFTAKERYPIRAMAQAYIDDNLVLVVPLCEAEWEDLCLEDWATLCTQPWN